MPWNTLGNLPEHWSVAVIEQAPTITTGSSRSLLFHYRMLDNSNKSAVLTFNQAVAKPVLIPGKMPNGSCPRPYFRFRVALVTRRRPILAVSGTAPLG